MFMLICYTIISFALLLQNVNVDPPPRTNIALSDLEATLVAEGRLSQNGQLFGYGWRNSRVGLTYSGHLHRMGIESLTNGDVVNGESLLINSPGGEIEAAISLAEWVIDHDIQVIVRGKCLSACAQYVLVASKRRAFLPGSWLSCHGNNIAAAIVVRQFRELNDEEQALHQRAVAIYEHGNVSLDFALHCAAAVEPMCVVMNEDNIANSNSWIWRDRYSAWFPDASALHRYGFEEQSTGNIFVPRPENLESVETRIVGANFGPPPDDALRALSSLRMCAS